MSGDVNAEVRAYQPSLRYDFDNIFHQDMRWSDEQAMLSVPTHENKAFFPFDIWNWGWSPNLRTPVCTQVRLYTAETLQKAVGFLFYHICHRSIIFENTKILSAKKTLRGWKESKRSWPISGKLLVRIRMRRVYKSYPLLCTSWLEGCQRSMY